MSITTTLGPNFKCWLLKNMKITLVLLLQAISIAVASSNLCTNLWKYPQDCQSPNCAYQIVWRFKPADDSIEFVISSNHSNRWTGIIFSNEPNVSNSDAIFAWIEDGRYFVMDAFLPDFSQAISDRQQSVSNISAHLYNGIATFKFFRKRNTNDDRDISFADDANCPYLIFPVDGGTVDLKTRTVIPNEHDPFVSDRRICIRSCDSKPNISSTPAPIIRSTSSVSPSLSSSSATAATAPQPSSSSTTTTSTSTTTPPPPLSSSSPSTTSTTRQPSTSTSTTTTTTTTTAKPTPKQTITTTSTTKPPLPATTTATTTTTTTTTKISTIPNTSTTPQPSELASSHPTNNPNPNSLGQQWCVGRWSYPENCRFQILAPPEISAYLKQPLDGSVNIRPLPLELSDCSYFAQWQYNDSIDSIEFIIQTKTRNRWTGIGFSNSTRMPNSDAIIGLIDEISGRHFIMDTWLKSYVMPEIDQHQNIEQTKGKRENGTSTLQFRRKRITGDSADFQFNDFSCAYFFFPIQGGSFHAISKRLHKHEANPIVSKERICIKSCIKPTKSSSIINLNIGRDQIDSTMPITSQPELSEPTSSSSNLGSQAPNLFLLASTTTTPISILASSVSSSSTTTTTTSLTSTTSTPTPTNTSPMGPTSQAPDKNSDSVLNVHLSPSNDLSAELDGSSSSTSTSASSDNNNNNTNPFNKLAFLSEPSLRWLAGIGCVATLLAMIVFQACFTVYKNKQAYKQNLYRQSHMAHYHGSSQQVRPIHRRQYQPEPEAEPEPELEAESEPERGHVHGHVRDHRHARDHEDQYPYPHEDEEDDEMEDVEEEEEVDEEEDDEDDGRYHMKHPYSGQHEHAHHYRYPYQHQNWHQARHRHHYQYRYQHQQHPQQHPQQIPHRHRHQHSHQHQHGHQHQTPHQPHQIPRTHLHLHHNRHQPHQHRAYPHHRRGYDGQLFVDRVDQSI